MGAIEEGGKVASGVVEGLKQSPLSLALIVMNVVCLGVVVWVLNVVANNASRRDNMILTLATDCAVALSKKDKD
jgi:hypothetical protein